MQLDLNDQEIDALRGVAQSRANGRYRLHPQSVIRSDRRFSREAGVEMARCPSSESGT
jgi:hypothetical protein